MPLSRREFMKLGGLGFSAMTTEAFAPGLVQNIEQDPFDATIDHELETIKQESHNSSDVLHVPQVSLLPFAWNKAVEYSRANNRMVVLELSEGQHVSDLRLDLRLPKDARITIAGSGAGSEVIVGKQLADGVRNAREGSKELYWAGSKHNLFKIVVEQGASLVMRDLELNGGCEEAGVGGYTAPTGPWNSVVRILGAGLGMDYQPIRWLERQKQGLVVLENVGVEKSISAGFLVQNVRGLHGEGIAARDVDAGVVANWCDRLTLSEVHVKGGLSDGIYLINNVSGEVSDSSAEACRQGLDIQGGESMIVKRFNSIDCAIGYRLGESEADGSPLRMLYLEQGDSDHCGLIYSLGRAQGLINYAKHTNMGGWYDGYAEQFSHHGIAKLQDILSNNAAVWRAPDVPTLMGEAITGKKSEKAPVGYNDSLTWDHRSFLER